MKYLLFLFLPTITFAQRDDFSIKGGVALNVPEWYMRNTGNLLQDSRYNGNYAVTKELTTARPVASVTYTHSNKKHFLYGVSIGYTQLISRIAANDTIPAEYGKSSISTRFIIGTSFKTDKRSINAGFAIGGVYNANPEQKLISQGINKPPLITERTYKDNFGASATAFFEYVRYFGDFGISGSVSPTYYCLFTKGDFGQTISFWQFPVLMGLHYKIDAPKDPK